MSVQMATEQLQQLIEAVRTAAIADASAAGAAGAAAPVTQSKGSFINCQSRFGGDHDHDIVEEFITSVVTYKEVEHISDEDALRELSLLFWGIASHWWRGVMREAKTWSKALELIRHNFSPTKPAYQVYMEVFKWKQNDGIGIDTFVCQKRALLAQLPEGRHDEQTEIDMIYGLLHVDYRKYIPRHDVKSFRDLLEKGRIIEQNNTEASENVESARLGGNRCSYCNFRGHTVENCRKKKSGRRC